MTFTIRNYEHWDEAPYAPSGAAWFDGEILDYVRGGSLCGADVLRYEDGRLADALCICTAPVSAWRAGDTGRWETLVIFYDRAGAKSALRVARWLLRGDASARLVVEGDICLYVGAEHERRPCWRRLGEAMPYRFPWRDGRFLVIGEETLSPRLNAAAERCHNRVLATSDASTLFQQGVNDA